MTDAEYLRRKRLRNMQYGGGSYSTEYPEFGELLVMLFKLLAEFFGSKFEGISSERSENDQSHEPATAASTALADDPEVEALLSTPSRTFTTMHAATSPSTQLPVEAAPSSAATASRPTKR